jgi:hypothetical protein
VNSRTEITLPKPGEQHDLIVRNSFGKAVAFLALQEFPKTRYGVCIANMDLVIPSGAVAYAHVLQYVDGLEKSDLIVLRGTLSIELVGEIAQPYIDDLTGEESGE